jgi:hypothetical protein
MKAVRKLAAALALVAVFICMVPAALAVESENQTNANMLPVKVLKLLKPVKAERLSELAGLQNCLGQWNPLKTELYYAGPAYFELKEVVAPS